MNNILPDLLPLCVDIELVYNDPDNVNTHPESQIESLRNTLRVYGQHKALVVQEKNGKYLCRVGNGTLEAARREGWTRIAVVRVEEDDVVSIARAIKDNTASWGSEFDDSALRRQLETIGASSPDLLLDLGWGTDELARILSSSEFMASVEDRAHITNDRLILDSKLDEDGLDEKPEEEDNYDYEPESVVREEIEPDPIEVSADEVCDWLDAHATVSQEVIDIISDIFYPAKFYRITNPVNGTKRFAYVVTVDG